MKKLFLFVLLLPLAHAADGNEDCTVVNNYYNYYNGQATQPSCKKCPRGYPGERGPPGEQGRSGADGVIKLTEEQRNQLFHSVLSELTELPKSCKQVKSNETGHYWLLDNGKPTYAFCNFDVPKTCNEVRGEVSGNYTIYPNGDGINVYCNFTEEKVITSFEHDSLTEVQVLKCESAGCYRRDVNYVATMEQMVAVIEASTNCRQYIKYRCEESLINYNGEAFAWWHARDGSKMLYWGGATSHRSGYCACGETGTCYDRLHKCNCDHNRGAPYLSDEGYLDDKQKLPVIQMFFGDTDGSSEEGWHSLGPLECWTNTN